MRPIYLRRIDINNWKAGETQILVNADAIQSAEMLSCSHGDYAVIRFLDGASVTVRHSLHELAGMCGATD